MPERLLGTCPGSVLSNAIRQSCRTPFDSTIERQVSKSKGDISGNEESGSYFFSLFSFHLFQNISSRHRLKSFRKTIPIPCVVRLVLV